MSNGFGQGRGLGHGVGRGMGFGFRGTSPQLPYVGIGRGGLPRCSYFFSNADAPIPWNSRFNLYAQQSSIPGYVPFTPKMDTRMRDLESKQKE